MLELERGLHYATDDDIVMPAMHGALVPIPRRSLEMGDKPVPAPVPVASSKL